MLERARRRPRGPRADDPRRHADVPGAVPRRDARSAPCPRRSRFLDTTENFAHYARDSYAKLIVAEDALLERLPAGAMARTAVRGAAGARTPGEHRPRRHAPGRHGVLAVQRRLDRLPEGRRAPAPRHPVHVRDLRARDPADHRATTSRSPRPSSTTRTGWATTSRSRTRSAPRRCCGPGRPDPQGPAGDRAGAPADACSSASPRCTARWSTCPTPATHDLSLASASACPPPSRSRPRSCAAGRPRFGLDIVDGIGSTEMLHIYCSNRPGDVRPGTSGKPVPGLRAGAARRARPAGAPTARSATCTSKVTARSPTTGTSTRRPRRRSRASCSSPATATASTRTATTSTRAAPTT